MGICSEPFNKHWILFPTVWHLPWLSQGRTQGRPKCAENVLKWRTFELTGWITEKRLKIDEYMLRCVWQALNPLSIHVTFTAIFPGEAKMCLRLSWRSQMPPPAKRVKATTYRRDSPEVAKLWLRLVFMQLTRDLFAIAKFLFNVHQSYCTRYSYRLDVCPSVCPSHAGILSKRLYLSSNCLHCLVAPWF